MKASQLLSNLNDIRIVSRLYTVELYMYSSLKRIIQHSSQYSQHNKVLT